MAWHVSIQTLPIKLVREEDQRKTKIFIPHVVFGLPCLHDVSVFLMFTIQLARAILKPGFRNQRGGGDLGPSLGLGLGRVTSPLGALVACTGKWAVMKIKIAKTLRTVPYT